MGTVPNANPVQMNSIRDELSGTSDLGYYRGRQYWQNTTPTTIPSTGVSMGAFKGLTNISPVQPSTMTMSSGYLNDASTRGLPYWGYYAGMFGSLSPNTFGSATIQDISLTWGVTGAPQNQAPWVLYVDLNGTSIPRTFFSRIAISGLADLYSATSNRFYSFANGAQWQFFYQTQPFSTGTFTVTFYP